MPLERVSFELLGERHYDRAFETLGDESRDMHEPLGQVGELILDIVDDQFETEGAAHLGRRWQPLSPAYAKWKARHYPGRKILIRTGAMRREMVARRSLTVRSDTLIYAPKHEDIASYHQGGVPENNLPARPMIVISAAEKRNIDRIFHGWLREIARPLES